MLYTSSCLVNSLKLNLRDRSYSKASSILTRGFVARTIQKKVFQSVSKVGIRSTHTQFSLLNYSQQQQQYRNVKYGVFGLGLGFASLMGYQYITHPIYNETAMVTTTDGGVGLKVAEPVHIDTPEQAHAKRKVIYKQMCLGSILGIGSAIVMVKVSSLLIYLTVFALLTFEWLRSRGIIDVKGSQLIQFGTTQSKSLLKRVKIQEMNLFKLSFLSTLLLTYANCG